MKRIFKDSLFLSLLFMVGMFSSCMEESGFTILWEGQEVEFEQASRPNGTVTRIFTKESDNQVDETTVRINLVGAHVDQPIELLIGADPESSAIAGVHYTLPANTFTIAPNTSFIDVPIRILTGNLGTDETPDLILTILNAGETKISANYKTVTIEIRLACPSDLAGTYNTVNVGTGGTINYQVTITELEPFTYRISDITGGLYSQIYGAEDNPAIFTELCGVISVVDQPDVVFGGDEFNGTGTVDANGVIRITWSNGSDESGTTTMTRVP
jgi:hypothetical protein